MPNLGDSTEIAPWRQDGVTREDVRGMFSRLYYVLENEEPVEACVIAEGRCWDPAELAGTATKSLELKFPRWYS